MEHRALVRPRAALRSLAIVGSVSAALIAAMTDPAAAQSRDPSTLTAADRAEIEGLKPYQIRAWLAVDPRARLGDPGRRRLIDDWLVLARRFVGAPWRVEVADGPGPLGDAGLEGLDAEVAAAAVEGADKGWFLRVEPADAGAGYVLVGREFDALTGQFGPLYRQPARFPRDAARSLFELSHRMFAPVADIERTRSGADLVVRGASLLTSDPAGRIVGRGTVFRPFWIFKDPEGGVQEIRSIPFTYLLVDKVTDATAGCQVVSGLRSPLPRQVLGNYRLVALGIQPADVPTRFHFVSVDESDKRPVAGYVVTARGLDDPLPREVGTTDRDGRITLPPKFSDELVLLRLLAAGVEPLREFPVLPGETPDEREVPVEPRPEAVAVIFRLKALQQEIVDVIASRGRLEALLGARSTGEAWDEVKRLLDDYQALPSKQSFEERVAEIEGAAREQQAELKVPVMTRTAMGTLAETEALIQRYMDDEAYLAYVEAYEQARSQPAVPGGAPAPTLFGRAVEPAPAAAPPPPPAGSGGLRLGNGNQGAAPTPASGSNPAPRPANPPAGGQSRPAQPKRSAPVPF